MTQHPALLQNTDALFAEWDKPDSPGCALAVVRAGEIACKRGYGMANLEYDIPITPTSVFHVASVSKQFTAFALALLAHDGRLALDDDVRRCLPELPDYGHIITLRHLIHHTSGLRDQWDLLSLAGWREDDVKTDGDVLDLACRQKALNFQPGADHRYSNTGYTLMGLVVQRVTGRSLRQFTDERIFQPLGMAATHFHDDHAEVVKNRACAYQLRDGGGYRISIPAFDTVGASSLFTTVEDLALWDGNFEHGRVGGTAVIEQMHARGRLNDGTELGYAFGLAIGEHGGLKVVEHSGGDAGYRSHFLRFPDERLSVILLCNVPMNPHGLARQVAEIWLADRVRLEPAKADSEASEAPAAALPEEELAYKAGAYVNRATSEARKIAFREGKLFLEMGPGYELAPLGAGRFRAPGMPVELAFEPAGAVRPARLRETSTSNPAAPVEYEAVDAPAVTAGELAQLAGRYASEELDATYEVIVRDGGLALRRKKHADAPLSPVTADWHEGGPGTLRFTRDAEQRVTGFTLSTGRIRGLWFERRRGAH